MEHYRLNPSAKRNSLPTKNLHHYLTNLNHPQPLLGKSCQQIITPFLNPLFLLILHVSLIINSNAQPPQPPQPSQPPPAGYPGNPPPIEPIPNLPAPSPPSPTPSSPPEFLPQPPSPPQHSSSTNPETPSANTTPSTDSPPSPVTPHTSEQIIPQPYTADRYQSLWKRSPFTLPSAVVETPIKAAGLEQKFILQSVAIIDGKPIATLYSKDKQTTITVTDEPIEDENGLRIVAVDDSKVTAGDVDDVTKLIVKIANNSEQGEITFDPTQLAQQTASPGFSPMTGALPPQMTTITSAMPASIPAAPPPPSDDTSAAPPQPTPPPAAAQQRRRMVIPSTPPPTNAPAQ
ncbi:MAG: hypothetical protein RML49_07195 [Verrucomicrobiae bacterium]|nr:hypothetical protein [Verrucomicrobiae bacterium]